MATIQIRDVPEDAYEVIRRRARAQHRSLQSYMRDLVIEHAAYPSKAEAVAEFELVSAQSDAPGATREQILAALAADRR